MLKTLVGKKNKEIKLGKDQSIKVDWKKLELYPNKFLHTEKK